MKMTEYRCKRCQFIQHQPFRQVCGDEHYLFCQACRFGDDFEMVVPCPECNEKGWVIGTEKTTTCQACMMVGWVKEEK